MQQDLKGLAVQSPFDTPEAQEDLAAEAVRLRNHLAAPENAAWSKRFDQRRGKRPYDPEWYQVLFEKKRSLLYLARLVHRLPEYRVIYELGSEVMHSSRSDAHVRILPDRKLGIRSLRELVDLPTIAQMLMTTGLHTFRRVLDEYRPDEGPAFGRKYVDTWRKALLTRITVKYQYHTAAIG
jgi:hypothetical protein